MCRRQIGEQRRHPGRMSDLARPLAILLRSRNGCGRRCCHLRQIFPSALRSGCCEQTSLVMGTLMQWFIVFGQGIMQDGQESEVAALALGQGRRRSPHICVSGGGAVISSDTRAKGFQQIWSRSLRCMFTRWGRGIWSVQQHSLGIGKGLAQGAQWSGPLVLRLKPVQIDAIHGPWSKSVRST